MDPVYSGDLFIDGFTVKAEPMTIDGASASVAIPTRRLTLDFDCGGGGSGGGSFQETALLLPGASLYATVPTPSFWGQGPKSDPTIKMEDDDIFQVDKSDLIQGPTLAELNANDETLLEDLNFDDLLLPEENSYFIQGPGCKLSPEAGSGYMSPVKPLASPVPVALAMSFPPGWAPPPQDLLCGGNSGGSSGGGGPSSSSGRPRGPGLSSSAPTHLGLEQIWQRREPRQHLLSTSSLAEATSTSSLSTGGVLSPEAHDFSLDEGFDSEDDSDHYEDFSSDAESGSDVEGGGSSKKKERYFWQYNVQAKGPKGQRLVIKTRQEDPHHLDEVTDPVFSPQCSVQGIKHSGKARKGDGNDLTPNPRKLTAIGKELDKLNRIINDMTPVSELPFSARPKTRKEKNKLASRACRLKKKAQHEANKIKLYGLESEHKRLLNGISQMKQLLINRVTQDQAEPQEISKMTEKIIKLATNVSVGSFEQSTSHYRQSVSRRGGDKEIKIAGQTTEFVNKVLDKVKLGVATGGLDELHH